MQQPTMEERMVSLEGEVEALKQLFAERITALTQRQDAAENIDRALLKRIDAIGSDLRSFQRETRRGFDELSAGQRALQVNQQALQNEVHMNQQDTIESFKQISDILHDHKEAIDILVAGQQQVIELLRGQPRRND